MRRARQAMETDRPGAETVPPAAPRARRSTPAESRRGRHTNTHVGRDPQNRNARRCSSCWKRPTQPGPEIRQVPGTTAIDRGGAVMPAGAFAASGPTRHRESKARSRRARAALAARTPWRALNLAPGARLRAGLCPRDKTVPKKVFRDNVVSCTPFADAARRVHTSVCPGGQRGRWRVVPGPSLATNQKGYNNV